MPFNIGPLELIAVLVIALLVLGPGKLPEVGSALGKSIREFRKAASDVQESARIDTPTTPQAPSPQAASPQAAAPAAATPAPPAAASPAGVAPAPPAAAAPAPQAPVEPQPQAPVEPNTLTGQSAPNEIGGERQA